MFLSLPNQHVRKGGNDIPVQVSSTATDARKTKLLQEAILNLAPSVLWKSTVHGARTDELSTGPELMRLADTSVDWTAVVTPKAWQGSRERKS
jgi:hypothetical protein